MVLPNPTRDKMHSDQRYLIIRPMEGQHSLSSTGLVDNRVFQGGNTVYAMRDPLTDLWVIKFASGSPPGPLRQQFTTLPMLIEFARVYLAKRNLNLVEVIDKWDE